MIEMVKTVGQQVGRVNGGSHKGIPIVQMNSPTDFKIGGFADQLHTYQRCASTQWILIFGNACKKIPPVELTINSHFFAQQHIEYHISLDR